MSDQWMVSVAPTPLTPSGPGQLARRWSSAQRKLAKGCRNDRTELFNRSEPPLKPGLRRSHPVLQHASHSSFRSGRARNTTS